MAPCPVCHRPAAGRPDNPAHPFCSARCRTVDLGQWLDERYRVPGVEVPDEDSWTEAHPPQEKA